MKHFTVIQRTLLASAVAVLAFGAAPAKAAGSSPTAFGDCVGAPPGVGFKDCVTAVGHISASVVGTLSINEMRAISFGNFAVSGAGGVGGATIALDLQGNRVSANAGGDVITLLHGLTAGGALPSGSQSPGHYTVEFGAEGGTTQVYISFADNAGNIVDTCSPGAGFVGTGQCDTYHPGNNKNIFLQNGGAGSKFFISKFVFNEAGSDVYGHYIDNDGTNGGGAGNPGITNPWGHGHLATTGGAGVVDVVVGATLTTDGTGAAGYLPGKYTGTYNVMVSY